MITTALYDTPEEIIAQMYQIDREWMAHYPGLMMLLPDTYGTTFYYNHIPEDIARGHIGSRIDSKDPMIAIPEYLAFLGKWNIDPKTKIALPSDGLTYDVIK